MFWPTNSFPATSAIASASSPLFTGTLLRTNSTALSLSGSLTVIVLGLSPADSDARTGTVRPINRSNGMPTVPAPKIDATAPSGHVCCCICPAKNAANKKNKGLTVLIFDDNRREVPNFSDALYRADPWYDPIYQTRKKRESAWKEISEGSRFNQIVNSAFAIKSHHSSFIQVADAVCNVYRRDLELKSDK